MRVVTSASIPFWARSRWGPTPTGRLLPIQSPAGLPNDDPVLVGFDVSFEDLSSPESRPRRCRDGHGAPT